MLLLAAACAVCIGIGISGVLMLASNSSSSSSSSDNSGSNNGGSSSSGSSSGGNNSSSSGSGGNKNTGTGNNNNGQHSRDDCKNAIRRWTDTVHRGHVDSTTHQWVNGWNDPYDSQDVRTNCGGCVKKSEYGVMYNQNIGVKRWNCCTTNNEEWDDNKRWNDGVKDWVASWMTALMPGVCA